jgi:hypothetical protein
VTNKNTTSEVVVPFPNRNFAPITKGSSLSILGSNNTGKTQLMFDIGAQLIIAGKIVGIISDELSNDEIVTKLFEAMKKVLIFEGISDELEIRNRMKRRVVIFHGFDALRSVVNGGVSEVLNDLDAILCDTDVPKGFNRSDFIASELSVLGRVKEDRGLITLYTLSTGDQTNTSEANVSTRPLFFDRMFQTTHRVDDVYIEELDLKGNIISTSDDSQ